MRSVKSTRELTRGRGIAESQRTQWLLSKPACADINLAVQEATGNLYCSSEQHKEITETRMLRDNSDTEAVLQYLISRNPFSSNCSLHNISNGVTAGTNVNADKAKEVGKGILDSMQGKCVSGHTFKRKDQLVLMDVKNSISVGSESISVDPQLLFQRLLTASRNVTDDFPELYQYELSAHPSSFFEPSGLMRPADKSALAEAL